MELRSNRSRSMTPFTQSESFENEVIERGNHVEKTLIRSSKRITTVRTNESATSSTDEVTSLNVKPAKRSTRSEKSIKRLYTTSDYSSEDGENEVSSTRTITQNERNQLIEDAKAAANGNSEVSALELYKRSGRYWDIYPKTDWTYSQHSRDRVELAPGIVAMPNMSRKTIHSVQGSDSSSYSDYAHKETNTESLATKSNSFTTSSKSYQDYKPRQLFNNNYDDRYELYEKHTYRYSRWTRIKRSVTTIFTSILSVFYYAFEVQTSWFAKLHKFTSRVMLLDTWLLWKTSAGNKSAKLVALCLVPLLLLGGWWIFSSLGSALYGIYLNSTLATNVQTENIDVISRIPTEIPDRELSEPYRSQEEEISQASPERDVGGAYISGIQEKVVKVTERIYLEPPTASEIAASLSTEQLESVSEYLKSSLDINNEIKTEDIVQSIIQNPSFQKVINNYNKIQPEYNLNVINNQEVIINNLKDEIDRIKQEMSEGEINRREDLLKLFSQIKAETVQNNAHLTYQLNRCCRKPLINIESYVKRILSNLLNDVEFMKQQDGFNGYLHNIFAAKQDLEFQILNLTGNLDSKFDTLIADNSRIILDDIADKIKVDMRKEVENAKTEINTLHKTEVNLGSLSDQHVKRIVKEALAIYDADKTGLVDYAMETMGGQILTTRCTENYHYGKAVVSVLGIPLWYPVNSPRTIITPSINPGECWAFQNFPGFAVIQLPSVVEIEAFSMEHISKLLVPNGKIDSAPKEFEVYGLTSENDKEPVKLGEYTYDYDGESLQFFEVQNKGHSFSIIEVRIISNHGNPNYTCLYRFRVHGKLNQEHS